VANERLREASLTDPLTGLGNRRFLREAVLELLAGGKPESARGDVASRRFVLMVVDLDFLKPINDRHGHDGGDRVLIQVAEILRQLCRSSDRIVRWGGDEFVVLCRDADIDTAAVLAERIRASIAKQIFRVEDGVAARTSASIGFAPYPFIASAPTQIDWEQSLALADAALYVAKQHRNDWMGWAGTARTGPLDEQIGAMERLWSAMEAEGRLDVRRRPPLSDDTVDRLRTLGGMPDR
jgi:diguanylate cyclase (GGDEF)-like protein